MPFLLPSVTAYTFFRFLLPTNNVPLGDKHILLALSTSAYTLMVKPGGSFILSRLYFLKRLLSTADVLSFAGPLVFLVLELLQLFAFNMPNIISIIGIKFFETDNDTNIRSL